MSWSTHTLRMVASNIRKPEVIEIAPSRLSPSRTQREYPQTTRKYANAQTNKLAAAQVLHSRPAD